MSIETARIRWILAHMVCSYVQYLLSTMPLCFYPAFTSHWVNTLCYRLDHITIQHPYSDSFLCGKWSSLPLLPSPQQRRSSPLYRPHLHPHPIQHPITHAASFHLIILSSLVPKMLRMEGWIVFGIGGVCLSHSRGCRLRIRWINIWSQIGWGRRRCYRTYAPLNCQLTGRT